MKKLLLIAMVIISLPMFAQNYTMRCSGVIAEDGFEAWDYIYASPEGTNMLCVNKHDFITPLEIIDSLSLDANGNIEKLITWQLIEGEWKLACLCEYTYNEMGLRETRTNYNNFDSLELGGVYTYEYDENGNMISWQLSFANIDDYQKATISYNADGLKEAEIILQYNFSTYYHEQQFITEYEYDANGNMVRLIEFVANESGTMVPNIIRVYEYDELNNCVVEEQQTSGGTVQERIVYTFDTEIDAENVYYYENPEKDWPRLPYQVNNLLKSFEYWAQNQDDGNLVHVADYQYLYEVIEGDAVEEVAFNSSIYPNPAQDFVMIESSEVDFVEVLDVYGRVVSATEMRGVAKVDMSALTTGIYFVRLHSNGETSVQKIMKK